MGQICCCCKSLLCHLHHLCKDQRGGTLIHRVFIPCKKHLIVQIASADISVLISHRLCLRDSYATATRESSPSMTFGWALTSHWRTAWVRGTSSRGGRGAGGQLGLENVHCRLAAPASTLPELSGVSASSSSFAHERNEGGWSLWVWLHWCEKQGTRVSAAQN